MARRRRELAPRPCARCAAAVDVLYRVRIEAEGDWLLVCPTCWPECSTNNPDYRYGGTWRAKKS